MQCSGRGASRGILKRVRRSITGTTRPAVLDHAIDPRGKIRHDGGRRVAQHALDDADVDGEVIVAEPEGDELLRRRRWSCELRQRARADAARWRARRARPRAGFPRAPRRARRPMPRIESIGCCIVVRSAMITSSTSSTTSPTCRSPSRTMTSTSSPPPRPSTSRMRLAANTGIARPLLDNMPSSDAGASGIGASAGRSIASTAAVEREREVFGALAHEEQLRERRRAMRVEWVFAVIGRSRPRTRTGRLPVPVTSAPGRTMVASAGAIAARGSTNVGAPCRGCGLRHPEDDRAFLVLRDAGAAGVLDGPEPGGAVAAHAGEHDADRGAPRRIGHRAKERIGGGTHAPHGRRVVERNDARVSHALHAHVLVRPARRRRVRARWSRRARLRSRRVRSTSRGDRRGSS